MKPTVDEMQTINSALVLATFYIDQHRGETNGEMQESARMLTKIEAVKGKSFGIWFVEAEAYEKMHGVKA